jgi:hypothetical protein
VLIKRNVFTYQSGSCVPHAFSFLAFSLLHTWWIVQDQRSTVTFIWFVDAEGPHSAVSSMVAEIVMLTAFVINKPLMEVISLNRSTNIVYNT